MASSELVTERSLYIGSYISGILYGVQLIMYFMSTFYLLNTPNDRKNAKFYTIYGSILLALLTIDIACNALFGQLMWIEHRDVPGGPAAYLEENLTLWVNTLGTASGVAVNFMGDALFLYRCYFIWASNIKVIIFPLLLFLAAMAMAILSVFESAQPGASFFAGKSVDFGVPYVAMTISFNVIVTLLICGRLLAIRKEVKAALGAQHARTYTSIAAMIVESAAPFSILGIAYVVSYALDSPTAIGFVQIWGKFCAISPQLLILRVAMGKAWSRQTINHVATGMRFSTTSHNDEGLHSSFELSEAYLHSIQDESTMSGSSEKWRNVVTAV